MICADSEGDLQKLALLSSTGCTPENVSLCGVELQPI